jgi:hypothetical protein
MDASTTTVVRYDDGNYTQLLQGFESLTTFAAAVDWDVRAQIEVERIADVLRQLEQSIGEQKEAQERVKQAHAQKSFFQRTFGGRDEEREIAKRLEQWGGFQDRLGDMTDKLQESMDFTPTSKEEQRALIKELRQRKKELQLEKREVNLEMRAIRDKSRASSVKSDANLMGFRLGSGGTTSKVAAWQRRQNRYSRQAALRPHEDAKAAIERQIVEVDKNILWAERFKE